MNQDNSPQPQTEQLLNMLEAQIAASRSQRTSQNSSRSKTGLIGVIVIVIGAAVALWMLMVMLEQMRPQHNESPAATGEPRK